MKDQNNEFDKQSYETALKYVDELCVKKVDITVYYPDWMKIAYGLVNSFGEHGRLMFHRVSSAAYPEYSFDESEKLYSGCLKNKRKNGERRVTVATFIKLAKDAGMGLEEQEA